MPEIIVFLISLAAAIRGADWLGRSSVLWAKRFGIPHFVVGVTFVSLATTLPELTIATIAGPIDKNPELAIGSVLGSPLVNVGIIMGIVFLFSKTRPTLGHFSRSINIFIVISFLLLVISINSVFGGLISILLISLGLLYLLLEFVIGKKSQSLWDKIETRFETATSIFSFSKEKESIFEFVFGAVFLALGCNFMVNSSISLANSFNIDELFLSITMIALGTSLPELITAFNSIIHKREGVAVGNLVGASVIDLTIGVGIATVIGKTAITFPLNYLVFFPLIVVGLVCLLALWKKLPINFVGGLLIATSFVFLAIFAVYEVL